MAQLIAPAWTLGDRIRKARKHARLSQSALGQAVRKDDSTIGAWENDRNRPDYGDLMLISQATGVPVEWLEEGGNSLSAGYPRAPHRRVGIVRPFAMA